MTDNGSKKLKLRDSGMKPPVFDHEELDRFLREKIGEENVAELARRIGIDAKTLDNYRKGDYPKTINILAALHYHMYLKFDSPLFKEKQ